MKTAPEAIKKHFVYSAASECEYLVSPDPEVYVMAVEYISETAAKAIIPTVAANAKKTAALQPEPIPPTAPRLISETVVPREKPRHEQITAETAFDSDEYAARYTVTSKTEHGACETMIS